MTALSPEEMERAMKKIGVPDAKARQMATQFKAGPADPTAVKTAKTVLPDAILAAVDRYEGMNKWERERAIDLEAMKRAGHITEWWYERWTFKLADDTRFTPDFVLQRPSGALEVEEVKGHWRDDALVKLKVFVQQFPFPTRALSRTKSGWDVRTFR